MPPKHAKASLYVRSGLFDALEQFRDLESRIEALQTPGERGAAFEVFVEAYLATQKTTQATEIWPEGKIPPAASKQLNLGVRHGVGIDGVYTVPGGAYYAYQVKFRTGRTPLPFNDVAPFFGITEAFAQRVLITNSDDLASQIN
ncbi:MAG: hypothetical protein EXR82_10625, partial [Gammaproteobacteria bacterium]|nr:hypothetical protein [Gammaproteobacteria bacterium]